MVHNYSFLDFFYILYCVCSCHTVLFWVHVCCIFIKPFLISDFWENVAENGRYFAMECVTVDSQASDVWTAKNVNIKQRFKRMKGNGDSVVGCKVCLLLSGLSWLELYKCSIASCWNIHGHFLFVYFQIICLASASWLANMWARQPCSWNLCLKTRWWV